MIYLLVHVLEWILLFTTKHIRQKNMQVRNLYFKRGTLSVLYRQLEKLLSIDVMATLFWPEEKLNQSFSSLKNPLNMAWFLCPLVTRLTGFHCVYSNKETNFCLTILNSTHSVNVTSEYPLCLTNVINNNIITNLWKSVVIPPNSNSFLVRGMCHKTH